MEFINFIKRKKNKDNLTIEEIELLHKRGKEISCEDGHVYVSSKKEE